MSLKPYIRLMRLPDQYLQITSVAFAGLYLGTVSGQLVWWAVSTTLSSCSAFVINEIVDQNDTDKYSWNSLHVRKNERLNSHVVWGMIVGLSLVSIVIAERIGLFWWAVANTVIGLLYSLPTVRFKARAVADVLAQQLVWWVIPFLAPVLQIGNSTQIWHITGATACMIWCGFFPYQLADFEADKRVGLENTHVILGLKRSLWMGMGLGVVGISWWLWQGLWSIWWTWIMLLLTSFALIWYVHWLRLKKQSQQISSFQYYVHILKPISQALALGIVAFWIVMF